MPSYKFEDCRTCRHRKRPRICRACDVGEYFEDATIEGLSFTEEDVVSRGSQSLVTAEKEPDVNPDDLIRKADDETNKDEDDE
jgi:hypothetical protein